MSPRPGHLDEIANTRLPRPRTMGTMEDETFVRTVGTIRRSLKQEGSID